MKTTIKQTDERDAIALAMRAQECLDRGVVFALYGEREEAAAFYRRALLLDPGNAMGHYVLGMLLMDVGDRDGALQEWRLTLASTREGSQSEWARHQASTLLAEHGGD